MENRFEVHSHNPEKGTMTVGIAGHSVDIPHPGTVNLEPHQISDLIKKYHPEVHKDMLRKIEFRNSLYPEQTQLKGKQIMEKKTKKSKMKEKINEADATSAAATLQTHPTPASSRAGMMAQAMAQMAAMDVSQLEAVLAQIGHEADNIPNGAAAQNKASVDAKGDAKSAMTAAMKEDVSELFGSEELTEEFKEKTAVLF